MFPLSLTQIVDHAIAIERPNLDKIQPIDCCHWVLMPMWAAVYGLTLVDHDTVINDLGNVLAGPRGTQLYSTCLHGVPCVDGAGHLIPCHDRRDTIPRFIYQHANITCAAAAQAKVGTWIWLYQVCGAIDSCLYCHRRAVPCPIAGVHMEPIYSREAFDDWTMTMDHGAKALARRNKVCCKLPLDPCRFVTRMTLTATESGQFCISPHHVSSVVVPPHPRLSLPID